MSIGRPCPDPDCPSCSSLFRQLGNANQDLRTLRQQLRALGQADRDLAEAAAILDQVGVDRVAPSGNAYTLAGRIRVLVERVARMAPVVAESGQKKGNRK